MAISEMIGLAAAIGVAIALIVVIISAVVNGIADYFFNVKLSNKAMTVASRIGGASIVLGIVYGIIAVIMFIFSK